MRSPQVAAATARAVVELLASRHAGSADVRSPGRDKGGDFRLRLPSVAVPVRPPAATPEGSAA